MLILVLAFLMVLVMWVAKVYMVSNVNSSKVGFLSSGTSWFVILWMDVKLSCTSCEKITVVSRVTQQVHDFSACVICLT